MKRIGLIATLSFIWLGACSAAPTKSSLGSDLGNGTGGAGTTTTGLSSCVPGDQSCFCPDGTKNGTQTCDQTFQLSSCVCPAVPPANVTPDPTTTAVCADLHGSGACSAQSYASQAVPSSILFVIDRSGSMDCNPPPTQTTDACNADSTRLDPSKPSKWEITTKALNDAFTGLAGSNGSVGLSFFSTDDICGVSSLPSVELAPASGAQLTALSASLAKTEPAGGTPIVGAVISAYHHLHEDLHAPGNRYVVLITDGEESCGTKGSETDAADLAAARQQLLTVEVQKAREANIKTFVVGSPGSEGARDFLSELAFQGGTANDPNCVHGTANGNCHFDLSTQADFATVLSTTLVKIGGKALGCQFQAPAGASASTTNVQYTQGGGAPVCFKNDNAPCDGGANGWQFAKNADGTNDLTRVVLCGDACTKVKADPSTTVDVVLGCDIIM